jgi:RHS repeat-associated protein
MYLRRFLSRMYHDRAALPDSGVRRPRRVMRGARPTLETLEDRSLPNLLVGPLPLDLGLASLASGLSSTAGEPDSASAPSLASFPTTRLVVSPFGQDLSSITNASPQNSDVRSSSPEVGVGSLPSPPSSSSQAPPPELASPFHGQKGTQNAGQGVNNSFPISSAWTPPISPPRAGAGADLAPSTSSTPTGGAATGAKPPLLPATPPSGIGGPGATPPKGGAPVLIPPLTQPPTAPPLGGSSGSLPPLISPPPAGPLGSTPGLMGLAQASLPPDITSGSKTNISYTQKGNNANPFHYDATPLAITLGDGRRFTLVNPSSGGARKTQLNLLLDNNGAFSSGVSGPDLSITGKVTIDGTTFNGTLVTGEVRGFGSQVGTGNAEFEVRIVITGGALTDPSTGYLKVGGEMALLLHQPGLKIITFPKTFSYSGTLGTSDARKMRERFTNSDPVRPDCGCATSDIPGGSTTGSSEDTGDGSVYLHDGESRQQGLGLTIPGRGIDWSFTPTYRSGIQVDGSLGHNWDFTDDRQLRVVNAEDLTEIQSSFPMAHVGDVVRLDGADRADIYVHNSDGSYTSPNGFFTRLVLNGDGTYSERDQGGTIWTYNAADKTGLSSLSSESDRYGDTLRYQYNSVGELSQVTDALGRPITYTYNSLGELTQVTDYIGRSLRFTYDASGELVDITSPAVTGTPTGNDFPNGQTTSYTYSEGLPNERLNHELLTVTAPNEVASSGPPRLTYTYDTGTSSPNEGRVTSLAEGGTNSTNVPAGGTIQYSYQTLVTTPPNDVTTPVFQTTVTDRNGNITQYQFNQLGNILQTTEEANRHVRPGDPSSYVTQYQYDMDYHLLQETLPLGNTIRYTYDTSNPDRFEQGNLLSVTETPDSTRGGDQSAITTTYTYEPIYNQLHTMTEPRGNDPSYVPQNGGSQSAARYTTAYTYDYQEGTNFAALGAPLGLTAAQTQSLLAGAGIPMGLGDVNGDGRTDQIAGSLIRRQDPTVTLLPGSNEAAVEGTTSQPIVTTYAYNDFGQVTSMTDPEGNVTQYQYYSERDPNGDGTIENPSGNPTTGGYLMQTTQDAVSSSIRDSGTNPPPANIRTQYHYDEVGNTTRTIDGRGIATDYVYNQLNQVVQVTRAAAHGLYGPDPNEPLPLTDFQYLQRYFYDYNDNVVVSQVEDRGNTSNVDGNPPAADLPATAPNPDPAGGTAFADTIYKYDILDQRVETVQEVSNGASPEFLHTRFRYDPNGNSVLTIQPEGNATSAIYDERDLLFQSTTGATAPPPLTLLAPSDPTSYDVRGGLPSTTGYRYDLNRNLIETVDGDDTDQSTANNDSTLAAGDRTRYIYDGFDRQTSTVDSVGNQTVTQYDPDGNVIRTSTFGPTGGASPTSDGPATLATPVSSLGVIQSGNLVSSNLLQSTESSYDELGRTIQTSQVLFVNTISTVRPPDVAEGGGDVGLGSLTPGQTQAVPGVSGVTILGRVSDRTEYDRSSRVTFQVQDDLNTSRTLYDGADRVIKTVDAEGNTVETAYDADSNVIETRETDVSQVSGVANEIFLTTNFYDSLDRLQQTVDNLGQSTSYRYDSRDNLVAVADANGPLTGATITRRAFPDGPRTVDAINDFGNVTRYFYDGLDRKVREEQVLTPLPPAAPGTAIGDGTHIGASIFGVKDDRSAPESFTPTPDTTQGGGDGLIRTGYVYDKNSLLTAQLDDQGNVTVSLYDNLNREVTETNGLTVHSTLSSANLLGSRTVFTPTAATINNPASIPTAEIDAQLSEAQAQLTAVAPLFPSLADRVDDRPPTTSINGYDPDSNVLIRSDENNSYTYTKYDAIDRPIAIRIFRAGQADSFAGDPLFAPDPVSLPTNHSLDDEPAFPPVVGTTVQNFQYDGLSRVTLATDNNDPTTAADDSTMTEAYDSLGRVIEETQQIGALPAKAIDSAWRAEDLRKSLTYPNGRVEVYTYDHLDRVKTIGDQGAPQAIAVYDYIGVDRVLDRLYPINGTRETYLDITGTTDIGYDGLRRSVEERDLRSVNSLIVGFTYTYDRADNKLTEGKLHDPVNSESYAYDSTSRLVHFQRAAGGSEPLQSSWTLDGVGNWKQVDGETRQYSSLNEIISRTNGSTTAILSDDNGNEIDDGTFTYTWDAMNRLRTVTRKSDGQLVASYSYDAAGRRIQKVVTSSGILNGTTAFYYDGWQELEEHNGADTPTQQFVYGAYLDEPLVVDSNLGGTPTRLFYHQNTLYSVYALTDTTGKIVEGYQYDAYGRQTVFQPGMSGMVEYNSNDVIVPGGSSAVGNPFLFTGQRLDAETGLFYYKNRYYATDLGRFLSRDPLGTASATDLYQYANGAPTEWTDPLGLFTSTNHRTITEMGLGGLGLGGACITKIADANVAQDNGVVTNARPFGDPLNHGDNNQIRGTIDRMKDRLKQIADMTCDGAGCACADQIFTLFGQVLHALQDLYSHSNYVETMDAARNGMSRVGDIPIWDMGLAPGSTANIPNGIITGTYNWPLDNAASPSHRELNKDSVDSQRGAQQNKAGTTYFALAQDVATRATRALWNQVFNGLSDACKEKIRKCCEQAPQPRIERPQPRIERPQPRIER